MTDVTDHYPSTGDLRPIAGGQDPVLVILTQARKRYKRGGVSNAYIETGGAVCAIGAIGAAVGINARKYNALEAMSVAFGDHRTEGTPGILKTLRAAKIEEETIQAAKKAIQLLNNSAKRLYPVESKNLELFRGATRWSSPLEALNQYGGHTWPDQFDYKTAVLHCYDDAIKRRTVKIKKAA